MFYISDNNYISSSIAEGTLVVGPDVGLVLPPIQASGKNYSTAVGTRSLSITSVPGSGVDRGGPHPTQNLAILYYENPAGNVSALLRRLVWKSDNSSEGSYVEWLDISQRSKSLPSDFLNFDPGVHTFWESNQRFGHYYTLSAPFTSRANFSDQPTSPGTFELGALFYAPDNGSLVSDFYFIGFQGPGNYSGRMHSVSSCPEWLLAS